MKLEGVINFSENSDSIIYTMNSQTTGQYCVVVPKNNDGEVMMLVDLNKKSLFDSLINNIISKDELVRQVTEEYGYVKNSYSSGILVMPMLDANFLMTAVNNNDKQKMFDETKKIGGITSEIYKKLTESGVEKSKINQKITILESNDNDIKFVEWLKTQMPNFVEGISLEELKNKVNPVDSNPFANVNPFTGEENKVEDKQQVEQVVSQPAPNDNIFGVAPNLDMNEPVVETPPVAPQVSDNNPFGSQPVVDATIEPQTVNPAVPGPQPVQSSPIVTETPVVMETPVVTEGMSNANTPTSVSEPATSEEIKLDKKSGGFANLLIFIVVLIGVTIVSIELGKFLYSVYGG